jgi:hypothetical protein
MTLNITMVNQWGIWQCSELRLTEWPSGKVVDDYSIKHVSVRTTDGAALIPYTGLGKVRGRYVSDWLRGIIRGESRTLMETLNLIRDRATAQLGPAAAQLGLHHHFSIGGFIEGQPWAFLITNMDPANPLGNPPLGTFTGTSRGIHKYGPQVMVTGGAKEALAQDDRALLKKIARRKPIRPVDYRRLMAEVNKRASEQRPLGNLISKACVTAYIPPAGEPFEHEKHWWGLAKSANEPVIPMTLFGVDLTEVSQIMMDNLQALTDSDVARREEARKRYERLMHEAEQRMARPDT